MVPEASFEDTGNGVRVSGEGWFVVNARDLRWFEGEMGLFTTDNRRTVTARCASDVEVLFLTYDEFRQLYFQQPSFGFYVLRLIVSRMEKNLELARQVGPKPEPSRPETDNLPEARRAETAA